MKKNIIVFIIALVVFIMGGIGISRFVEDQVYIKAQKVFHEVQAENEGQLTELKKENGGWLITSKSEFGTYEEITVSVWNLFGE